MLSIVTIILAVLAALFAVWHYAVRADPPANPVSRLRFVVIGIAFFSLAVYSFYLIYNAGMTGMFACSSTRCGSSDAYLSTGPLRYWMLYCMYWALGLVSTFVGAAAVVVVIKRPGRLP